MPTDRNQLLYHGSLEKIEAPEIRLPNRTLDYGSGFYLTSSSEQAEKWVRRKLDPEHPAGFLNAYLYDPAKEAGLDVLTFRTADENWLDFVMANRMDPEFRHYHDIVKGPVADDRVYAAFALYEARLLSKEQLIKELRTYKLVDQILLHTQKSLGCICFHKAIEITL